MDTIHPVLRQVTDRIADRSPSERATYLDRIDTAADAGPARGRLACATIAHGFLSLSLLSAMAMDVLPTIKGQVMGINYGFDKVRFMNPVREGSKVRGKFTLLEVKQRSDKEWQLRHGVEVEIEGQDKPALIAEWLSLAIVPA